MPQQNGDGGNNYLFGSTDKDEIFGFSGNDLLVGIGGTDVLDGGIGDDKFIGGTGLLTQADAERGDVDAYAASLSDTFTGGAGADRFVISAMPSNASVRDATTGAVRSIGYNLDLVTDFTPGVDKIVIVTSSTIAGSFTFDTFRSLPAGTLSADMMFTVGGATAAPDQNDFLIYDRSSGNLFYDADGSGTAAQPAVFLRLTNKPALSATDFEIIASNTITGTAGDDTLSGTATIDRISAQAGNDSLQGNAGDDILTGGLGFNKAVYSGDREDYLLFRTPALFVVDARASDGDDGMDSLFGIERIQFRNNSVAYDLVGNAGDVVRILGAVFGRAMVGDQDLAGIGLYHMDKGLSYETLMEGALNARLGAEASNRQVVDLLYSNIVGSLPSEATAQFYVELLETGAQTRGSLGVLAADTTLNESNINLVGLGETGLTYIEFML
jgi:Ca2+-binding RTX toxin-like protein